MQETVVSEFYRPYYLRGICGALLFPSAAAYMFYLGLFGNLATPLNAFGFGAMFLAAACIFFYFFTKSWKRVTVTPTEIEVYNVVLNKRFTIPYADIKEIGTYRRPGYTRFGNTFARHLVIEFGDGRSFTIDETFYNNYSQLTMAIYLYKYGPGHGRERYLERHGMA